MKYKYIFFILTLVIIFSTVLFSQGYQVQNYSEADGLPSANVYDVSQDPWGRMWFATRAGIAVYDGVSWKTYTTSDGLPGLSITHMEIDQKGRIWALAPGEHGEFVVVYHDIHRENDKNKEAPWIKINAAKPAIKEPTLVTSFQLMEQKSADMPIIAVGTTDRAIFLWNAFNQGKWKNITTAHGLLCNSINGIVPLNVKFYLATDQGLSIITIRDNVGITIDNKSNQLLDLPTTCIKGIGIEYRDRFPDFPLKHSRIWLSGNQWLGYFDENSFKITYCPVEIFFGHKDQIVTLFPDYRGGIYMGIKGEVNYFNYNTHSWEIIGVENGLIGDGANSIFIDFEKSMWIVCERGVSKISSRRFSTFQRVHGLLEDEVTSILEYEQGKFILGHNYGITFYDGDQFTRIAFSSKKDSHIPSARAADMKMDSKNNIWIAAAHAGLAKINPHKPHQITWYNEDNGLSGQIVSVWIDKNADDRMWVATDKGIFIYNENKTKFDLMKFGKFNIITGRRIIGANGKLSYIGGNHDGLYVYSAKKGQWINYRVPDNSRANSIYALKIDSYNRVLLGTLAGVFILEKGILKKFRCNGFQVDRPVFFILEDLQHRFWFGTDLGVVRWDGKTQRKYSSHEGLIGLETNRAAAIADSKGKIWFGTNRSLSIYDEQFDTIESAIPLPRVRLMYIEASDQRIPLKGKSSIRLSSNQNILAFHFKQISFLDEAANRIKHRLEGLETGWSKETYSYNQMIRYINVPPGEYRFHLKSRNAMGVWSDVVSSPRLIIMRPAYQTWWFFILLVTGSGIVFYGVFRFFSQKHQATLLEKQVKERNNQLQTVEKRYQTLFEESKDVVFQTTLEGHLVDLNSAGVELFGFESKEEALNINSILEIYYSREARNSFREEITRMGYVKDYEMTLKRKDGEPISSLVTATLVRDRDEKIIGFRGIIRDITGQKKLEHRLIQAQKMEAIGTLAGGIAHDFNNILGAIVGYSELALDDLPEGTLVRKNIQHVLTGAERAAELVKQILAFSRETEQERKPIKLGNIVTEALKLLRSSLPATIEIRHHIKVDSDTILGDPTQIHQVMMNLGANASHAMQENGGILEVRLDEVILDKEAAAQKHNIQPGPYLRLTVSDTGHGIPTVVLKRIFEPYFTTKKTGEGTGMGLAVIHGIVKGHGGDISVYSEPGQGTNFYVFFPKIEESVIPEGRFVHKIPGGNERILLVDDEAAITSVGSQMLERLGYEVKGISNPIDALESFKKEPDRFHLVISDLTMPYLTGLQLAEEVKKINPGIPIIICSGFSASLTDEQIKAFGINDFIMKPFIKSELAQVVRKVLDSRPLP